MDYDKIYDSLINRASERTLSGYKEKHHIRPKCVGGEDIAENIVELTADEHYVCHQLLVKMKRYSDHINYNKLIFAANMMTIGKYRNNKKYKWLKIKFSKANSEVNSSKKQSKDTIAKRILKNTGKKRTAETKQKIASSKIGVKRMAFSLEWRRNMGCPGERNGMYGKHHTCEAKEKISKANKGRVLSEEQKKQISIKQKGLKDSEETKRLKSESMKASWKRRKEVNELKK